MVYLCFPFDFDTFNSPIFSFALALNVLSKFPVPISIRLPVESWGIRMVFKWNDTTYSSGLNIFLSKTQRDSIA